MSAGDFCVLRLEFPCITGEIVQTAISISGNTIRLTAQQWIHTLPQNPKNFGEEGDDMGEVILSNEVINGLLAMPARQIWTDYDEQADVLYISFRKPQQANDSVMEADDSIYHYRDEELVGITVLNASKQKDLAR
jgi:uncharacterized protein YuzE